MERKHVLMYVNGAIFCFALLGASLMVFGVHHWVPKSLMVFTGVAPILITALIMWQSYRAKQSKSQSK